MSEPATPAHPLYATHDTPLARINGRPVSRAAWLADVHELAARLPEGRAALNLCEDRYRFSVAFAAILLRGQMNLLPPARGRTVLAEIARGYSDPIAVVDSREGDFPLPTIAVTARGEAAVAAGDTPPPEIPLEQTAILGFSSGSTGTPTAHPRRWGDLVAATGQALQRLEMDRAPGHSLVATVPPQHMYGLESTVLLALLGPNTLIAERPFYPADVHAALAREPRPVLISTPFHLGTCLRCGQPAPASPARVLSATAPLEASTARELERHFDAPVTEIYGCTEAGAIATRRTVAEHHRTPYPGVQVNADDGTSGLALVQGPQHAEPVPLPDCIEVHPDGAFHMTGRLADMLNIAGKRASLVELNRHLQTIPGVEDGVFIPPAAGSDAAGIERLAALVVAPELDEATIQGRLAGRLDPAFLPRPLVRVEALPRSATGKLPRQALLDLLARHGECA
ncbi:AMP-binding protein [Thioalkalivibrio sp. ALJ24]|uniref:AMP-binding protein n=1 Tax=Thioalkalivibrio sp. ALJ24 TaxID=545276 RepID=UPI000366D00C|nr:AMP-binding protein [Thioalkalivibrio sp. ALJ24]